MAVNNEIPVRRRRGGGLPWWAWLIGLALLALLAFWLLSNMGGNSGNNNSAGGAGASGAAQSQAAGASGGAGAGGVAASGSADAGASGGAAAGSDTITTVAEVSGATDAASVAGRSAEIEGATVESVTGDVTFWVGESAEDRVFVLMDEDASGGEQGIQIEEGQTLRITGQVDEVPSDTAAWDLSEEDAAALAEEPVYIAASRVEVAE